VIYLLILLILGLFLVFYNRFGGAPPLVGEAGIAFRAFIFIDDDCVKYQAVVLFDLIGYHKSVFGAVLRNAESAF
jgi:hypothetical protein